MRNLLTAGVLFLLGTTISANAITFSNIGNKALDFFKPARNLLTKNKEESIHKFDMKNLTKSGLKVAVQSAEDHKVFLVDVKFDKTYGCQEKKVGDYDFCTVRSVGFWDKGSEMKRGFGFVFEHKPDGLYVKYCTGDDIVSKVSLACFKGYSVNNEDSTSAMYIPPASGKDY